jgi:hypothetical protein
MEYERLESGDRAYTLEQIEVRGSVQWRIEFYRASGVRLSGWVYCSGCFLGSSAHDYWDGVARGGRWLDEGLMVLPGGVRSVRVDSASDGHSLEREG